MITAKEEGVSKGYEPLPSFLTSTSTTTISKLLFAVLITNKLSDTQNYAGNCMHEFYKLYLIQQIDSSAESSMFLRRSANVSPTPLKTRSTEALVAGTPRYCLAIFISRNRPYIGCHLAFFFKLNSKQVCNFR